MFAVSTGGKPWQYQTSDTRMSDVWKGSQTSGLRPRRLKLISGNHLEKWRHSRRLRRDPDVWNLSLEIILREFRRLEEGPDVWKWFLQMIKWRHSSSDVWNQYQTSGEEDQTSGLSPRRLENATGWHLKPQAPFQTSGICCQTFGTCLGADFD